MLAWLAIHLAGQRPSLLTPIGAVWILALPLLDMGTVMVHRLQHGRSPFAADRRHLHYLLVDAGMSVDETVCVLVLASLACGVVGIALPLLGVPEWVLTAAFLAAWVALYVTLDRRFRGVAPVAARTVVRRELVEK